MKTISRLEPLPALYSAWVSIKQYPQFLMDFVALRKANKRNIPIGWGDIFPQLQDKTTTHGFDHHYVYHPAWAARIIAHNKPSKHVDISSILHFSTIISAFVPVDFYDYRPANLRLSKLQSKKADLTKLHFKSNSVESLSCMHTVEHIGLGRYGDPIDPDGDLKAMSELARVLKPGGTLLFVVPVSGQSKVMFNAHRIYSKKHILEAFAALELKEFTLLTDSGIEGPLKNPSDSLIKKQSYGCGCFWFVKPKK